VLSAHDVSEQQAGVSSAVAERATRAMAKRTIKATEDVAVNFMFNRDAVAGDAGVVEVLRGES